MSVNRKKGKKYIVSTNPSEGKKKKKHMGRIIKPFALQRHTFPKAFVFSCGRFQATLYDPGAGLTLLLHRKPEETFITNQMTSSLTTT